MKLAVTTTTPPLSVEDIRRGIDDSAALVRMARVWDLRPGRRGLVGRKGPAFTGRGTRGRAPASC